MYLHTVNNDKNHKNKKKMKILGVLNNELVEVLWIDDNEISYIPIDEFINENPKYKHIPVNEWTKK